MTDTTLIQRLRTDVLWYRRRGNETIAEDCRQAADALEQQAAQIAMLEQRATCGCGDQFTAHDPGTCGNCCAAADRSNEIEALRADAERMRADLISCRGSVKTEHHHYERLSMVHGKTPHGECYWAEANRLGDLLDRIDSLASIDAALRQEQPNE